MVATMMMVVGGDDEAKRGEGRVGGTESARGGEASASRWPKMCPRLITARGSFGALNSLFT